MSEEQQAQPQLALERIYTKDISFEVPGAQVFTKEWQPELNINLSSAAEKVDATHFEVSLKVVVQANNAGDTAFIVDVTQSGIFLIDGIEEDRLRCRFERPQHHSQHQGSILEVSKGEFHIQERGPERR